MVINPNEEIKKIKTLQDKAADRITTFAGSMSFVYLHTLWFIVWIALNAGLLGVSLTFDTFPFGLLTLVVSLEAIFLSTFVMISQNRQAKMSEIRAELDYQINTKAEQENNIIFEALGRIAEKQGIELQDLRDKLQDVRKLPGISKRT